MLGIIEDAEPYQGAPPLRIPTAKAYYMSLQPTRCLDRLRAALQDFNPVISSCAEYNRVQDELIGILARSMLDVTPKYTGPHIAKTLVDDWSQGDLVFDKVTVKELRAVCADTSEGLGHLLSEI